jgi:hypothetical protein
MTKWEAIATPREFGGLEIINTRLINDCLLVKWIWRLVKKEDSLWCKILYGKYLKGKDFFSSSGRGGGGFKVLERFAQSEEVVQMEDSA